MIIRLILALAVIISARSAQAQTIHLSKVVGGVWYKTSANSAKQALTNAAEVGPGWLETAADGAFYGSTGAGSKFRVGPSSKLQIDGIEHILPCGMKDALVVHLFQGKLTAYDVPGANGYDVNVAGGRICIVVSLCVLCMHGGASHIYVARGEAKIFPKLGAYRQTGLLMKARPTVAALDDQGHLEIQPLTSAAPGTSSCLLSGASPEVGAAIQEGSPNPINMPGNPPVSETQ